MTNWSGATGYARTAVAHGRCLHRLLDWRRGRAKSSADPPPSVTLPGGPRRGGKPAQTNPWDDAFAVDGDVAAVLITVVGLPAWLWT